MQATGAKLQFNRKRWRDIILILAACGIFSALLGLGYHYQAINQYKTNRFVEKATVLAVVDAFFSTYSDISESMGDGEVPVPATFRAHSLENYTESRTSEDIIKLTMVGYPDREIRTVATDEEMRQAMVTYATGRNFETQVALMEINNETVLRTVRPSIATRQSCVDCHNRTTPTIDPPWKMGDVMGMFVVDAPAGQALARFLVEAWIIALLAFFLTSSFTIVIYLRHVRDTANEARTTVLNRIGEALQTINSGFALRDAQGQLVLSNNAYQNWQARQEEDDNSDGSGVVSKAEKTDSGDLRREVRAQDRWLEQLETRTPSGDKVEIITDITSIKKAEESLQQAQKMEAVGQLTGGIAHDFNNLLSIVQGNAELIAVGNGTLEERVESISKASSRGRDLTQRLLAFARQQPLLPQSMNLAKLVENLGSLLRSTLGETISLSVDCDADLWLARADASQVENAIINLCINARDAMPSGGTLTIHCENKSFSTQPDPDDLESLPGDYVVLSVRDSGTGMEPDVRKHAFEPFFTTKEVGQGSGLGLSMVYGFAKQSGGFVVIESDLNEGTKVSLALPRAKGEANAPQFADRPPINKGEGQRILVIEDEDELRVLATSILTMLNYEVLSAPDAKTAQDLLDKKANGKVDLILCDVVLPGGVSGPQLAQRLEENGDAPPFIFMSGYAAEQAIRYGVNPKTTVLLDKPFEVPVLAKAVSEVLSQKSFAKH